MVYSPLFFPADVDPEPFGLQDEEAVLVDEIVIGDRAFAIGQAFLDERRPDIAG